MKGNGSSPAGFEKHFIWRNRIGGRICKYDHTENVLSFNMPSVYIDIFNIQCILLKKLQFAELNRISWGKYVSVLLLQSVAQVLVVLGSAPWTEFAPCFIYKKKCL